MDQTGLVAFSHTSGDDCKFNSLHRFYSSSCRGLVAFCHNTCYDSQSLLVNVSKLVKVSQLVKVSHLVKVSQLIKVS